MTSKIQANEAKASSDKPGKKPVSHFSLLLNGVFVLRFEADRIYAIAPHVHDHVYWLGQEGQPFDQPDYFLEPAAVRKEPKTDPVQLGWKREWLFRCSAAEAGSSADKPHAIIVLPYPKAIQPFRVSKLVFENHKGVRCQLAAGACVLEYKIEDFSQLRVRKSAWIPSDDGSGRTALSINASLRRDEEDVEDAHPKHAFESTKRLLPGLSDWSLVAACVTTLGRLNDGPVTTGSGANCKHPIVVVA